MSRVLVKKQRTLSIVASVMPMTSGLQYRQLKLSSTIVKFLRPIDCIAFRVQYDHAKRNTLMDYCVVSFTKLGFLWDTPKLLRSTPIR